MTTSKFQRWFEALTCDIIHISIFKNYTMSSHSKSASFLTPDLELLWGSPENFPKLLVPGPYWVASITSRPSPSCKRNGCCGPKQHHLSNTIYKAPNKKKIKKTERKRVWKIQYRSSSNSSKNLQKKISAGWTQVENTRDPLAARAKTLKGFSAVVKKPGVKVHHVAPLETVSLWEKVCSLDSMHSWFHIHPGRLTWNLQITHFERKMIFQTPMIMLRSM